MSEVLDTTDFQFCRELHRAGFELLPVDSDSAYFLAEPGAMTVRNKACIGCGRKWQAIAPANTDELQCPGCGVYS
jgi:hypothetical protein